MSRRYFEFNNFRNLGLEGNIHNKIIINNSLEKGKLGNLIILIGANNSGKSNVLDGILEYGNNQLNNRDVTTLSFNEEDRHPSVKLVYEDDDAHIEKLLDFEGKKFQNTRIDKEVKDDLVVTKDTAINSLREILNYAQNYFGSNVWVATEVSDLLNRINEAGAFDSNHRVEFDKYVTKVKSSSNYNTSYKNLYNLILLTDLERIIKEKNVEDSYIYRTYNYKLEPNIVKYKEKQIQSSEMNCSVEQLENNLFFRSVFKAIGIDVAEMVNGFKQYQQFKNPASLNKLRKMTDKKIEKLNDQFNKLYFAESDEYKFTINIESNSIGFGMARGEDEDPIMIEMQSTGFRWFFNLYFNFICSNELKPGDIIVMDEPATNLHPEGQKELRAFIKKFAIENNLTFIIATHSPFLIDADN